MVKLVLASAISQKLGERTVDLDFEGSIKELLEALAHRYGDRFSTALYPKGRLSPYVNVYVDGRDIRFTGGLDTPVAREATVDFIPAIAGG